MTTFHKTIVINTTSDEIFKNGLVLAPGEMSADTIHIHVNEVGAPIPPPREELSSVSSPTPETDATSSRYTQWYFETRGWNGYCPPAYMADDRADPFVTSRRLERERDRARRENTRLHEEIDALQKRIAAMTSGRPRRCPLPLALFP